MGTSSVRNLKDGGPEFLSEQQVPDLALLHATILKHMVIFYLEYPITEQLLPSFGPP